MAIKRQATFSRNCVSNSGHHVTLLHTGLAFAPEPTIETPKHFSLQSHGEHREKHIASKLSLRLSVFAFNIFFGCLRATDR